MTAHISPRSADQARRGNLAFGGIVAAVLLLGAIIVWFNTSQQDRLSTVRQTQVTGQKAAIGQRTDQTQLTCALWALMRDDTAKKLTAEVRSAADRICSTVPTPSPSK